MIRKICLSLSSLLLALIQPASAHSVDGRALVNDYCTACHEVKPDGGLARISEVRKTPEGWDMTIFRMEHLHGLELDPDDRHAIIRYLATEYGLAPSETAPFRYAIENRAHFVDHAVNKNLDTLCGRCHTNARYGLQRRTERDWLKHMHFHIGQFPSLEYQARARDRHWWREVSTKTYRELVRLYPFQTAAWDKWKAARHKSPVGTWRVSGHRPGQGDYQGVMKVIRDGNFYKADYDLHDMAGKPLKGDSKVIVYNGYEWRGAGLLNGTSTRETYALSEDGNQMTGRWFVEAHYDIGGEFHAVRMAGAKAQILSQSSRYIRVGEEKNITFYGIGLAGKITSDKGLDAKVITRTDTIVSLKITADKNSAPGRYKVTVGQAMAEITLYDHVDSVKVIPEMTIARLGGGHTPPVTAQFEAVAYMKTAQGDIKIGIMPAKWTIQPFDDAAAQMKDVDFAGNIDDQGHFMPAGAGPNPDRKYGTNNAGNLSILARVGNAPPGKAHLIVTVQRWNLPPVR